MSHGLPAPVLVSLSPSQRRWAQISMGRRAATPPPPDTDGPALRPVIHAKKPIKVRVSYWEAVADLAHYYDVSLHEVLNRFIEDGLRRYDNGDLNLQERAGLKPLRSNPFSKLPTHGPPIAAPPPVIDSEFEYGEEESIPHYQPLPHPASAPLPSNLSKIPGLPFMPQGVGIAPNRDDA